MPSVADAPPVPSIPKKLVAKSQRRAASVEPPPMRVASPPPRANGRGSSLGPAGGAPISPRTSRQRMSSLSNVQEMPGLERADSRGSVNFSYPTGNRPMSPYGHRKLTSPTPSSIQNQKQNMVYDANTRSFRPEAEVLFYEQQLRDASRPVKKKKAIAPVAEGSHLANGSMDGRARGTALAAPGEPMAITTAEPTVIPLAANKAASVEPAPVKKKKKKVVIVDSDTSDVESDMERPQQFNTRAGALLARQPSIIREGDEEEEDSVKVASRQDALRKLEASSTQRTASPLPRSSAGRGKTGVTSTNTAVEAGSARAVSQPHTPATAATSLQPQQRPRVQSISPSRKAHFLTTPDSSLVRHDPPERSISPRKSALKHSPSPRGPSPSTTQLAAVASKDEAMENIRDDAPSTEPTPSRKKSVRVSFDEGRNEVLGNAAPQVVTDSPMVPSPQSKKGWFNLGRKKGSSIVSDDDEKMTPRPALPSFGSVRERKGRDVSNEERPLVTSPVTKPVAEASTPTSPLFTTATGEAIEYPLASSSDHGLGAVLAQDQVTKNMANISKVREPVAHDAPSKEVAGYQSDNSSVYDDQGAVSRSGSVKKGPVDGHADAYRALASPVTEEKETMSKNLNGNGHVPEMMVTSATPVLENKEWPDMPGGFPANTSSESGASEHIANSPTQVVEHVPTEPTPAAAGIAEPTFINETPETIALAIAHPDMPSPIRERSEESDEMYSDAAEDLSDLEGDGFMSLNAVVESPVAPPPSKFARSSPPDSPTGKGIRKERAPLIRKSSEPDIDEGWEKAQQYWSGLTAEKKRAKELAALQAQDADDQEEETEVEEVVAPSKPKSILKPALKKTTVSAPAEQEPSPERQYQIKPGQKQPDHSVPSMRTSLRGKPVNTAEETHMRRSMRDGSVGSTKRSSMRSSLRDQPATQNGSASLLSELSAEEKHKLEVQKHVRALSAASAASSVKQKGYAPSLQRTGSDASDSSFKKSRRAKEGSIRGSMRNPATRGPERALSPEPTRSSRFSIRSLSPTGSTFRRPFNSQGSGPPVSLGMGRQTMRNRTYSNESNTPTLRSVAVSERAKSPSGSRIFGGKKKSKKPAGTMRTSRFADSSDEEDVGPSRFQSRFDSSDEDEPVQRYQPSARMSTMRQKPQRVASSVIGDSDYEEPRSMTKAHNNHEGAALASGSLRRSGSGRETIGATTNGVAGTTHGPTSQTADGLRPSHKRRGSFMTSILGRKKDARNGVKKSTAESPARRDTPLERNQSELAAIRQNSDTNRPRLQKRGSTQNGSVGPASPNGTRPEMLRMGSNWPLGPGESQISGLHDSEGRPFTSDGVQRDGGLGTLGMNGSRPELGPRRATDASMAGSGPGIKKKKKFGLLRRAFGLDV